GIHAGHSSAQRESAARCRCSLSKDQPAQAGARAETPVLLQTRTGRCRPESNVVPDRSCRCRRRHGHGGPMRTSMWPWFCAWFLVGALASLGLLTALTIGIFLLPVALAAGVFLATRRGARGSRAGLAGLVSGLGVPLLYVAFLNREGPGNVCTTTATGQSCVD